MFAKSMRQRHAIFAEALEQRVLFAAFDVTNTNDSGAGSLRQALLSANALNGLDTITFSIATGAKTISVTDALPEITDPVTIDGTTQEGYAAKPLIAVVPTARASGATGFNITGGGSTIQSLVVSGWASGITLDTLGSNVVRGCYIGTDFTGTQDEGNSTGIFIRAGSSNNSIGGSSKSGRNVISGNLYAIQIQNNGTSNNVIRGNYIGLNAAGTAPVQIGGTSSGISVIFGTNNIIGGTVAGAGNVIAGLGGRAIDLNETSGCTVQGNFIGTDATGTAGIGNGEGIAIQNSDSNTIGGTVTGAGNVVALSNNGISITGSNNVVQGNFVGTDITATKNFGNVFDGIIVGGNANLIGGTAAGTGNTIAFNGSGGSGRAVAILLGSQNRVQGNSIFSNEGIGIDLNGDEVTQNDPSTVVGDSDSGPNGLQNFPIINVAGSGLYTSVSGELHSSINTAFRLEFFANNQKDPSGFGEGKTFLGFINVTTNSSGDATFSSASLLASAPGSVVTATATDAAGNTSEFSPVVSLSRSVLIGTTLNISGSSRNDVVSLSLVSGKVRAVVNGVSTQFKATLVRSIGIALGEGNDSLTVGTGILGVFCDAGGGNDNLTGGDGVDSLKGNAGKDTINGGGGSDRLYGGSGNDSIIAATGNDRVFGDAGNDTITGNKGIDILDGGSGTDTSDDDSADTRTSIELLL